MAADSDPTFPSESIPTPPPGRVYEVLTPGEQIGDFTVESCLAYDILGSLYHVSSNDGTAKTLFVLPKLLSEDEDFLRRFRDFKAKQVQLHHPRILGMGDSQTIDGRICFVAEPTAGKSLPDHLGAAGIFPTFKNPQGIVRAHPSEAAKDFTPEKIRKVAREVLEAMDFAHTQGVLHLNLTPSNMLLLEDGDVKVLGFGLYGSIGAQSIEMLVSAGIPPVSLGPRNVRLNTADIISPEVHLKQEPDARADIYAFGMSVYWLLTGLKPGANYRPPSGIVPGLEPGWDIFLARCLTRERSKRYSNAKAALKDLENLAHLHEPGYADDLAGTGAAPGAKGAVQKVIRKKVAIAAIAGATVALGAGGVTAYFLLLDEPEVSDNVRMESPITRHTGSGAPVLTIRTNPPRTRVMAVQGAADFGVNNGELRLAAKPGTYTLNVTAPEYLPQRITVRIPEGGKPLTRSVTLFKHAGTLEVTTAPGALVSLLGEGGGTIAYGETDSNGKLIANAGPGTYTLLVEKEHCTPANIPGVVIKEGERLAKAVELEGALAQLILKSSPDGASVTIDGNDSGTTPITLSNIKPGRAMTVVFTKENYRPVTRKVVLDAGDKRELSSGPMTPARGTIAVSLKFSGRAPTAAQLAGLRVARSDDGLVEHTWSESLAMPREVSVGSYLIKVAHPDYETYQSAFVVRDDETSRVNIDLRALPAKFELLGIPENLKYTLRLNTREYTEAPKEIPADIPIHAEIEVRDHETWTADFTARPRELRTLKVDLKRLGPPVFGSLYTIPYMGTKLLWIAPGETRLGSPTTESGHSVVEEPFTRAKFTQGFWMARTEVTQLEYERVLGANPSRVRAPSRPVESVGHSDAVRYCKALTRRESEAGRLPAGWEYRLPTEIEWEYACRAGKETAFSFGDSASPSSGNFLGTYPSDTEVRLPENAGTKPVGSYPPNAYGLCDMHGNVREWTLEPYKNHLPGGRKIDYSLAESDLEGDTFPARGGSWRTPAVQARSSARPTEGLSDSAIADDLGFRIVLAPVPTP